MSAPLLYLTGTNTGVGKTTLACLLLRRARERNLVVAALKPFCSGGREDAEKLHALQTAGQTLGEINPFYFDEPIAPLVAARNKNREITLAETLAAIDRVSARNLPTLIEGAGGLMSPLGERFTLLDVIHERPGSICVVAQNALGVVNSCLLTFRALEKIPQVTPRFVLMNTHEPDASAKTNAALIREWINAYVTEFPFLPSPNSSLTRVISQRLDAILAMF